MKLSRRRGLQLEAFGSVLIVTVILADRFLFTIQDGFILTCAVISAVALTVGIRIVKRADEKAAEMAQPPEYPSDFGKHRPPAVTFLHGDRGFQ